MPIYEYQCPDCQHRFDVLQKVSDLPVSTCPECNKNAVVKLVSAAGFQLKGTGWYVTDFKNKGTPKADVAKSETKSTDTKTDIKTKGETS